MTHDTEALRGLLAKVEAASKGSPDLDAHILCALLAPSTAYVEQSPFNGAWCVYEAPATLQRPRPRLWEKPNEFRGDHASVTSSIDAALALVERVLPGHKAGFQPRIGGKSFRAHLLHITPTSASFVMEAVAPTAPLAILGSLLETLVLFPARAALAQGGHHEA